MVRWVVGSILHDGGGGGGVRCSSVVRAFAHGAMGRRIDPSWGGGNNEMVRWVVRSILHGEGGGGARCSSVVRAFAHGAMGRRIDPS